MVDVARLAGVSHQTVSRVINGSDQVRAETRERVLEAMRELDYRPNSRGTRPGDRALAGRWAWSGSTRHCYGPASTLFGIQRAAHDGRLLHQHRQPRDAGPRRRCSRRSSGFAMQGVDGNPRDRAAGGRRARACCQLPADIPIVAVEGGPDGRRAACRGRSGRRARGWPRAHLLEPATATVWHIAGPGGLVRGAAAHRRLGAHAARGRRRAAASPGRRLEPALRLRARAGARCRTPT